VPDPAGRPTFAKSPPELIERFEWLAARRPEAERRKMFGYPALFVGGNLVTGLYEASWMIRLPEAALAELLALPGAVPFGPMPGRPMKGYGTLPASTIDDDAELDAWVGRAIEFGRTLPPKR
jgi:TfoX/Sxy family transcriptional regulator of competence genes